MQILKLLEESAFQSENINRMNQYTALIPLLYPLNLDGNAWFPNLYKNVILSIFLDNPGRAFGSDELIKYLSTNYSLKVQNVPEFEEILSMLSKEDQLILPQGEKYLINPSKQQEVEDYYTKVIGIDEQEDGNTKLEFESILKEITAVDESGLLWNSFYNELFLPLVYHFYIRLTNPTYKTEKELLQSYKSYINRFLQNKDEVHELTTNFLIKTSTSFFKKHLIACIFYESVNGEMKNYDSILKLLDHPDNLDLFLERNMIYFMEIMLTMYSIEERLKSSTASIASLLFEDSFNRNLHYTDITNKQNDFFKKNLRAESSTILENVQNENAALKTNLNTVQNDLSNVNSQIENLKENFNKQSKYIFKIQSTIEEKFKEHTENSINNLKNRNVEIINKITELSMIFVPATIILLSAVFYLLPAYILPAAFGIGIVYLVRVAFHLFEFQLDKKLIEYFKNELKHFEKNVPTSSQEVVNTQPQTTSELQAVEVTK